jgi:glycosyltransferase involved in cell wall biosynthesis
LAEPVKVHAIELSNTTNGYHWRRAVPMPDLVTLASTSVTEKLPFSKVLWRAREKLAELEVKVCLLPSYSPKQSLAALLAAKSLGIQVVMMNDSHAGTARTRGVAALLKRRLVGMFDAALVAGKPQKRHFIALGLPQEKIFTGYDAVDNDYFAWRTEEVRSKRSLFRDQYGLPEHYFLSLGRFVAKKNLDTLIRAYRQYLDISPLKQTHLVMVGSGEEEPKLGALCGELQLPIYDHSDPKSFRTPHSALRTHDAPGVHFYGFRQIDENPVFYALADAFILPSLWEEWGLVVNEAMASGLPVAVSETAGCAEDLLEPDCPAGASSQDREQIQRSGLGNKLRLNGFVFSPNSAQELSLVLVMLEESGNLRAMMGAESRRIVEKFSCENFARSALRAISAAQGESIGERPATEPVKLT